MICVSHDIPYDAGRAEHPHGHPVLVILSGRRVEEVGHELPPAGLQGLGPVGGPPVPELSHDLLAVHGVVVALPRLDVAAEVLQLVPVGREDSLKGMADHQESGMWTIHVLIIVF